ncbi:MAG TPA: helix-turn-helix domain-containing protein [Pyrinomonadaceae bacterium]|jgi:transcriptional regulator with GAF, ATPase, and Fis domain
MSESRSEHSSTALTNRLKALRIIALALLDQIDLAERSLTQEYQLNISEEVHRYEAALIRNALVQTGGKQRPAARLLGMKVTTLHAKVKRYKIDTAAPPEGKT